MLTYITSNKRKVKNALRKLNPYNIQIEGYHMELEEIQSEMIEDIAMHKEKQAFESIRKPLIVSDHGWFISALNGFPGAYMKEVNKWLTAQDFLNLMKPYDNKEVLKKEVLCYIDNNQIKVFSWDLKGRFIETIRGDSSSAMDVITFMKSGKSVSECIKEDINSSDENTIWQDFASWYHKNRL